jgi:ATP-dependent helicase/nuclease subunit A
MASLFSLTEEQHAAVTITGKSVIVSAAAGSGKTTVLAERCAYLVCDAPPTERCDVDQLLVLTFTEAAASEMRSRIVDAIRRRSETAPHDDRLREQKELAEAAQISTIHGFCLWMIRRWFDLADIDPMATVLDAEEASLLKKEVLDGLFERLYAATPTGDTLLGEDLIDRVANGNGHLASGPPCAGFTEVVEVYGLGEDREIGRFVLKLYEFCTSQPDPHQWLREAVDNLTSNPHQALQSLVQELRAELAMQMPHCESVARAIESGDACGHDYAGRVRSYAAELAGWLSLLNSAKTAAEGLDQVRERIEEFEFERVSPARNLTDPQKEARERARCLADEMKASYAKRLQERFGFFSSEEWIVGLAQVAPATRALVELVQAFGADYTARKRQLNALDFSDLERLAFHLVSDGAKAAAVVSILRRRYAHVLVDEFQDINPVQRAILEAVSREGEADQDGNLFVVGDVKQSIYRFRLAEPEIFLERLNRLRNSSTTTSPSNGGTAVFLQSNFRSRPEILDAVNVVFRTLMTGTGHALTYDKNAELRAGLPNPRVQNHIPVELHLLERRMAHNNPGDDANHPESEDGPANARLGSDGLDRGTRAGEPSSRWDPIVREAYLIGTRIRDLTAPTMDSNRAKINYGDIAILLRSTKINADRVAGVLASMGIPSHADVGGSLMGSREVRDVVAALELLDNLQQDIPLAGVLRSGIFGDRFTEDELVEIRLIDRHMPFHAAVRLYADRGREPLLRQRLHDLLQRIGHYREEVNRRPVAQTLWSLLERQGYMAYASGLPNGAQRRANLLKFYDLARGFSTYRRQGLHRFLRLVESLADEDQSLAVAPASGAGDDVVRIMSIHHAKGMEFPVVFVAGLGTKFNLGDRNGRMIFERKSKIGLRGIDTERMIEYPTAAHSLVASEVERTTRDEELRVLYVAMTRAKQRLILLGSMENVGQCEGLQPEPTAFRTATAMTPLDWLLPVLGKAPDGVVSDLAGKSCPRPVFQVSLHDANEMEAWMLDSSSDRDQQVMLEAVSRFEHLPSGELAVEVEDDRDVERAVSRMRGLYPWLAASSVRATVAASEFRPGEILRRPRSFNIVPGVRPKKLSGNPATAADRGTLTHQVLQHINFHTARDASGVAAELGRMISEGTFNQMERAAVLEAGIAWFASTPLAEAIRNASSNYRRELRFVTTEPLHSFDDTVIAADDDRVLVRGIVDGIVVGEADCEIVDFKTDAVSASEAAARCEIYRSQMEIYARAVERLWSRPVRRCRLVFLAAQCVVDLERSSLAI